jgi:cyclic dehypoxanthinyl futalosine synthase
VEALSAVELHSLAVEWGIGLRETLVRLREAGLGSIAAENADARVGVGAWVAVHRAAHEAGMRTVARISFGAGETPEQRVDCLDAVRRLQEETGGFGAFVPVPMEPASGRALDGVTAVERLKALAIARIFLDSVENVQVSAAGEGLKVLQMGLRFGGNDVGSLDACGASEEDVRRIIRDAGFRPAQRDLGYRALMLS